MKVPFDRAKAIVQLREMDNLLSGIESKYMFTDCHSNDLGHNPGTGLFDVLYNARKIVLSDLHILCGEPLGNK